MAGTELDVEVHQPAGRDVDGRQARPDHARVEDDRRVGAGLVGLMNSTIECPPVSSSPSQANRTLTGKVPAWASSRAAASIMYSWPLSSAMPRP